MPNIEYVDIVVGVAYGDEAKGKISSHLASSGNYDFVARWAGGNNAGHTVYVNQKKYKTHLVPSGVFHGVKSVVGPGCVLHPDSFMKEIEYLKSNGFDTSNVKVSPRCHIVTQQHIDFDKQNLAESLGTTSKGIAPAYASKAARTGILAADVLPKELLWDEVLYGKILCEGAQGVWLDLDHGTYPYVTSSTTLPYGACSIGFAPQKIRKIYGAAKIYDTRSGVDPLFPRSLLEDKVLLRIGDLGQEYGVTTGRRRIVNWLNLSKLIAAVNISGTTDLIISKCDVLEGAGAFCLFYNGSLFEFQSSTSMKEFIASKLNKQCGLLSDIKFSYSPENI